jgi:hypothetical protein
MIGSHGQYLLQMSEEDHLVWRLVHPELVGLPCGEELWNATTGESINVSPSALLGFFRGSLTPVGSRIGCSLNPIMPPILNRIYLLTDPTALGRWVRPLDHILRWYAFLRVRMESSVRSRLVCTSGTCKRCCSSNSDGFSDQ